MSPILATERVGLRPPTPDDVGFLYSLAVGPAGQTWRFRGSTPSFEEFASALWHGVTLLFIVTDDLGRPIGAVSLYGQSSLHRYAYVSIVGHESTHGDGRLIEAAALLLWHSFSHHDLRKVYAEVPAFNLHAVSSGLGDLIVEEGRLRDHEFYAGKWWDLITVAIYRDRFMAEFERLVPFVAAPS